MRRVCFTLQAVPERIEEYRRRHAVALPNGRPDNSMVVLDEVLNLDDQLARIPLSRSEGDCQ
ncbi:MAG: hypothetical protein JXA67_15340 [Micromonosporaceae bacterium]|nr:hypothetical protein [Micromonosporaceae bacterium]